MLNQISFKVYLLNMFDKAILKLKNPSSKVGLKILFVCKKNEEKRLKRIVGCFATLSCWWCNTTFGGRKNAWLQISHSLFLLYDNSLFCSFLLHVFYLFSVSCFLCYLYTLFLVFSLSLSIYLLFCPFISLFLTTLFFIPLLIRYSFILDSSQNVDFVGYLCRNDKLVQK